MVRSMAERYLVGTFAFMAAATWLGVGVIHGLMCLLVALAGSQGMRIYQRRGTRAHSAERRVHAARRPRPAERPDRSRPYDADRADYDLRPASDAAW